MSRTIRPRTRYVTELSPDESGQMGVRYPLERLSREPSLAEFIAREKERVRRIREHISRTNPR